MSASPAWFFSTLAQASAAIVGLTIAFTISAYTTRQEYRQNRTDRFQDELIRYQEKYQGILSNMSHELREQSRFDTSKKRFRLSDDEEEDEVEEWAEDQQDTEVAKVWAHLSTASNILSEIEPALNPNLDEDELGTLHVAARRLPGYFDPSWTDAEELYKQLSGDSNVPQGFHVEDVLGQGDRVETWLARNLTERYDNQMLTQAGEVPSGENFYSWATLLAEFRRDTKLLSGKLPSTELTDFMSPKFAVKVLWLDFWLTITGVLLPSVFLVSSPQAQIPSILIDIITIVPQWIRNWGVYGVQIILIGLSGYFTIRLFVLMFQQIVNEPPTTMNELLGGNDQE